MSKHDVHTLTGAYAVDALVETERCSFEHHLADCEICAVETRGLQAAAARLAVTVPAVPSAALRRRVLAEVAVTRQLPPRSGDTTVGSPRGTARMAMAAAAALAVIATGLGVVAVSADRRADEAEQVAQQIATVATDPDRVAVTSDVQGGGLATVVAAGGDAVFAAQGLAELGTDQTYQLWAIGPDETRSLGLLQPGGDGAIEQYVSGLEPGAALGLTVEPEQGSPQPTTPPVVTLDMGSA
jgi:anti-sigma factor RsiW